MALDPRIKAQIEFAFPSGIRVAFDEQQAIDATLINDEARAFALEMADRVSPCRELSLALTALEEATMWAVKAIAKRNQ